MQMPVGRLPRQQTKKQTGRMSYVGYEQHEQKNPIKPEPQAPGRYPRDLPKSRETNGRDDEDGTSGRLARTARWCSGYAFLAAHPALAATSGIPRLALATLTRLLVMATPLHFPKHAFAGRQPAQLSNGPVQATLVHPDFQVSAKNWFRIPARHKFLLAPHARVCRACAHRPCFSQDKQSPCFEGLCLPFDTCTVKGQLCACAAMISKSAYRCVIIDLGTEIGGDSLEPLTSRRESAANGRWVTDHD